MSHKHRHADEGERHRVSPTAPQSASTSGIVWAYLEAQPGFIEDVRAGERQIAEGQKVTFSEVRRRR